MSNTLANYSQSLTSISQTYLNSLEIDVKRILKQFPTLSSVYCSLECKVTEEELTHFFQEMQSEYWITITTWDVSRVSLILHRKHLSSQSLVIYEYESRKRFTLEEALELHKQYYTG